MEQDPNRLTVQEEVPGKQWESLEELGEAPQLESEGEQIFDSETSEEKEQKLASLKETAEELSNPIQEQPVETQTEQPSSITPAKEQKSFFSIFHKKKSIEKQLKMIDRLANGNHNLPGRSFGKDMNKIISLAESGEFDLDDPRVAMRYTYVKLMTPEYSYKDDRFKTGIEKIDEIVSRGVSTEILAREAVELIAQEMHDTMKRGREYETNLYEDFTLADLGEAMDKYNLPQIGELLKEKVDVQAYGDQAAEHVIKYSYALSDDKETEQARKSFGFLKKIGYEPFKDEVEQLVTAYDALDKQERARRLSLLDGDIVDKMYRFKYKLMSDRLLGTIVPSADVLDDLECSGKDKFALFIKEHKQALEDAGNPYSEHNQHYKVVIAGVVDTCLNSKEGGGSLDEIIKNVDSLEGPDKGVILALSRVIKEVKATDHSEDTKAQEIKTATEHILRLCKYVNLGQPFFDENGIVPEAVALAITEPSLSDTLSMMNQDWKPFLDDVYRWGMEAVPRHPDITKQFSPQRKSLLKIAENNKWREGDEAFGGIQHSDLRALFEEDGTVRPNLAERLFEHHEFKLLKAPEINVALEPKKRNYLEYMFVTGEDPRFDLLGNDNLFQFFDENGPKPELWQREISKGNIRNIKNYLEAKTPPDENGEKHLDYTAIGLTENQAEVIKIYEGLSPEEAKEFADFASKYCNEVPIERIRLAPEVIKRLKTSNSYELNTCCSALTRQLLPLNLDDDEKVFKRIEEIESVFLRNNLPFVGKVFSTFRILHPPEQFDGPDKVAVAARRGILAGLPNTGAFRSREQVLWNDLLKATIGSNNRNLRKYLEELEDPNHLAALANNTEKARSEGSNPEAFAPTERYSTADRIVRSFAYGLGYKSEAELKEAIDRIPAEADKRNRERLRNNDFSLGKGDLVKATGVEYLGAILQNGAVCKEFLNGQAESDSTPLDADLGMFEEDFGSISEAIDHKNETNLYGSMHCILVLKSDESTGRNRFQNEGEGVYDPNKYEIWNNRGENHGIRVGFPSTEIDFIVFDDLGKADDFGDLNRIKYEVARNGFFIPIVDKRTGEPVFTEEEYEILRHKMRGLKEYEMGEFVPVAQNQMRIGSITINDQTIPSTDEIVANSQNNHEEVDRKRGAVIKEVIMPVLQKHGLQYKPTIDGNIEEGTSEVIDTGSTGRYSNAPHDGDFDFMMKLDKSIIVDKDKMEEITAELLAQMGITEPAKIDEAIKGGNIRAKDVELTGLDVAIDIDITFSQKTNKVQYSTDMALKEYYDSMTPEDREQVVANVIFAKKFFKAIGAYKPNRSDANQGGLGGVGVENWILQNGGSFREAVKEFMEVAKDCSDDEKGFNQFKSRYGIFDFGENHTLKRLNAHDNFVVDNMNSAGYVKMKKAFAEFLSQEA